MAKFIVHRIAPITGPLILCRTSPLETEPRPLRALHVTTTNTRFVVERKVDPTGLLVGGQMELRNNAGHELVIQAFRVGKGKLLEAGLKVDDVLAHYIIGSNLLGIGAVGGTSHDHIVSVCVPVDGIRSHEHVNKSY